MAILDEAQGLWAKIQAYAAQFLLTDQQILEARKSLQNLRDASLSSGSVKTASGAVLSTAQIDALLAENSALYNEGQGLKGRLSELMDQYNQIKTAIDVGAEAYGGDAAFPGILGPGHVGQLPALASVAAWVGAAGLLYWAISSFLGRVKDHIDKAAGGLGGFILSTWMIVAGLGLAYLLWGRSK